MPRRRHIHNTHTSRIPWKFLRGCFISRRDAWRLLRIQTARCIRGTLVFAVPIRISRRDVFHGTRNADLKGSAPPPRHCMWTVGMITCRLCRFRCRVITSVVTARVVEYIRSDIALNLSNRAQCESRPEQRQLRTTEIAPWRIRRREVSQLGVANNLSCNSS